MKERGPGTTAVHGRREAPRGPLATPIAQTSTFAFGSTAEMRRYLEGDEELFLYSRYANPTVRELEEALAAVEGAEAALALSSGMAAMTTAVTSPVHTSHYGLPEEKLREGGIDPGMVRLSLGVEDAPDLIADVEQALAAD